MSMMFSFSNPMILNSSRSKFWIVIGIRVASALIIAETTRRHRRRSFKDLILAVKDFDAFIDCFKILPSPQPPPPVAKLQLTILTFAVSDNFDVKGFVSGFGNPEWAKPHEKASRTAVVVSLVLKNGAKCVGRTVMDEFTTKTYGTSSPCHLSSFIRRATARELYTSLLISVASKQEWRKKRYD